MNDLFYFTREHVRIDQLSALAAEFGYRTRIVRGVAGDELNVYYQDGNFWQWIPISASTGDFDSFEGSSRGIVDAYHPKAAYIVAHRPLSWPLLRSFLRRVLDRYGGWVGNDTDDWEPTYTRDNIDHRAYPAYQEALDWKSSIDSSLSG